MLQFVTTGKQKPNTDSGVIVCWYYKILTEYLEYTLKIK